MSVPRQGNTKHGQRSRRRPAGSYRTALSQVARSRIVLIAVLGVVAAALSLALTASTLIRRGNPDMTARMMPIDSLAMGYRAERLLAKDMLHPPAKVGELARAALRLQALNPAALRVLGFVATAQADQRAGRSLILQAQHQSRRDAPAQFWLIEDAVQRGDVRGALVHYDIVLRNKPFSHDVLFPILLNALNDPSIRAALRPYIRTDEIWAPQFASYALANGKDLNALVALMLETGGLKDARLAQDQAVGLIARLLLENRFAAARRIYLTMPGATVRRLVDSGFDRADVDARYGAIGWQTRTQADASSDFIDDQQGGPSLQLSANALTTADIATKLLYLQPGRYRIDLTLSKFEGGDGAAVGVQLRCPGLTGNQPIWSQRAAAKTIRGDFVLPTGCDAQYLDIVVSGGASASMLDAVVRSITVRPL